MLDNKIAHLFSANLRFKDLCVDMLSRQYGFSTSQITQYNSVLNFGESYLMYNKNILWDVKTIATNKDKIDWSGFWKINGVELDLNFFEQYKDKINFRNICFNQNIDWSNQLLDTYKDHWDWERLMFRDIAVTPRNIAKYKDFYDWDNLSSNSHLKLTEDLIDTYIDKWNWKKLSANDNLKLDKKGIEKYKEHLCFFGLSRNPSMVPFILAYPNDYEWNWNGFTLNRGVVFGTSIIKFLIKKFKPNNPTLRKLPEEVQLNFAKNSLIRKATNNPYFNREVWFSESFQNNIPWMELMQKKSELLTTQEIEDHLKLDGFERTLPYRLAQKLSKKYIKNNIERLLNFRFSLFRYGSIDLQILIEFGQKSDWFNLAFNEQFDWSLDFLERHLDKFETNYGLSQNEKIYESLFGNATNEDIENLLKSY
jgi:hypothetical protein